MPIGFLGGAGGADHLHRVDDAEAGIGIDVQPQLVGREHLLRFHVDRQQPLVHPHQPFGEGDAQRQAGSGLAEVGIGAEAVDDADRLAEAQHHGLLGLRDNDDAGRGDAECDGTICTNPNHGAGPDPDGADAGDGIPEPGQDMQAP